MINKRIGIVGWNTSDNSFGVTKPYIEWLSNFGTVEILSPQPGIVEGLDLLVLPGGLDLAPQEMGVLPSFYTSNTDVMKQYFYDVNLKQYLENITPIFGICLGFQQLGAYFGGRLTQNYPFEYSDKHRGELVDTLTFESFEFPIQNKIKPKPFKVNSLHHQGFFSLPTGIEIIAKSQDENIEAAKFGNYIYGVQWHPEEINDQLSVAIINKLLKL